MRHAGNWPDVIVFDLDGTLVDSAPDIARSLAAGFGPLGIPPFPLDQVKTMIGGGASVAIRRAAEVAKFRLDPETEKGIYGRFMETYAVASAEGKGIYPGAIELLETLRGRGIGLGLCTNKSEPIAHIALDALRITRFFDVVIGQKEGRPRKPDPAGVVEAFTALGAAASETVMIGDSQADIGAARSAGCRSIAVSYGYSRVPVKDLGADCIVDRLQDIPVALTQIAPRD